MAKLNRVNAMQKKFVKPVPFTIILIGLFWTGSAIAQDNIIETAKPADSVSPYGVSYVTGGYTYSLPLVSIGNGDWPHRQDFVLSYDSSGHRYPNKSWTHNLIFRMSDSIVSPVIDENGDHIPEYENIQSDVILGNRSFRFSKNHADRSVGSYLEATSRGTKLEYSGASSIVGEGYSGQTGTFTFTGRNGEKVNANLPIYNHIPIGTLSMADGMKLKNYGVGTGSIKNQLLVNSKGLGILIEDPLVFSGNVKIVKICTYNLAVTAQSSITNCSGSNQVASIRYERFENNVELEYVTQVIRPDGGQYNFEYQRYNEIVHGHPNPPGGLGPKTRYHLSCVKEPGQNQCLVQNIYDPCDGPDYQNSEPVDPEWTGSRDRVIRQNFADGRQIDYSYSSNTPAGEPCRAITQVTMNESGTSTLVGLATIGFKQYSVVSARDPLNRTTSIARTGGSGHYKVKRDDLVSSITTPEGNKEEYIYDGRGNVTQKRLIAKSSSGQSNIVINAAYPSTCSNFKICNKATSVTDAEGNTTTFTYSSDHGGILTSVGTAVDGVAPAKKYYYAQKYAWVKQGSSYVQGEDPVWLMTEERSCKTSSLNLSNGTCSAGLSDLVKTTYDYGPNSGPNNLWLRGVIVTADGQSLRTCYRYDQFGRKISETQPKANLTSCPA